jgi:hypothetical protein
MALEGGEKLFRIVRPVLIVFFGSIREPISGAIG